MRWLDGITDSMDMGLRKLLRVGEGQGSLASCSPWGCKESDITERLNNKFHCKNIPQFVHLLADGHLGPLQLLAIPKNVTMKHLCANLCENVCFFTL